MICTNTRERISLNEVWDPILCSSDPPTYMINGCINMYYDTRYARSRTCSNSMYAYVFQKYGFVAHPQLAGRNTTRAAGRSGRILGRITTTCRPDTYTCVGTLNPMDPQTGCDSCGQYATILYQRAVRVGRLWFEYYESNTVLYILTSGVFILDAPKYYRILYYLNYNFCITRLIHKHAVRHMYTAYVCEIGQLPMCICNHNMNAHAFQMFVNDRHLKLAGGRPDRAAGRAGRMPRSVITVDGPDTYTYVRTLIHNDPYAACDPCGQYAIYPDQSATGTRLPYFEYCITNAVMSIHRSYNTLLLCIFQRYGFNELCGCAAMRSGYAVYRTGCAVVWTASSDGPVIDMRVLLLMYGICRTRYNLTGRLGTHSDLYFVWVILPLYDCNVVNTNDNENVFANQLSKLDSPYLVDSNCKEYMLSTQYQQCLSYLVYAITLIYLLQVILNKHVVGTLAISLRQECSVFIISSRILVITLSFQYARYVYYGISYVEFMLIYVSIMLQYAVCNHWEDQHGAHHTSIRRVRFAHISSLRTTHISWCGTQRNQPKGQRNIIRRDLNHACTTDYTVYNINELCANGKHFVSPRSDDELTCYLYSREQSRVCWSNICVMSSAECFIIIAGSRTCHDYKYLFHEKRKPYK